MPALSDRDTNTKLSPNGDKEKKVAPDMKSDESREQKFYSVRLGGGGKSDNYVSPSDAIVSPASQKLAAFKQRQINKQASKNPAARTLFARSASTSNSVSGLEDCEDVER